MRWLFEGFELDPEGFRLLRSGVQVPIERRTLDLLCYFAANPQRLIARDELIRAVWQVSTLSEGVLANTVAKLRKAIEQDADAREPLETVRGRGYRWHPIARRVARREADDAPSEPPLPRPPEPQDPFVPQGASFSLLTAAIESARRGRGRLIVVAGDAGVGKTRLTKEVEALGRRRGLGVLRGAGYDRGAAPAYWPWVELVRELHRVLSATGFERHLPSRHAALAQLVPELCAAADPAAHQSTTSTLRFELFDELTQLFRTVSAQAPWLVIIDDLHWADPATVELLAHVARALERQPIVWIAALRERSVAFDEVMTAALLRLDRLATRVALEGLTRAEVAELVVGLHGEQTATGAFVDVMFRRSQGNPLFVRQVLGLLEQRGALSQTAIEGLSTAQLPPAVRGVIHERVARLDEATHHVLSAATVAGNEFDAPLIASALEMPTDALLAALEPALAVRVLEPSGPAVALRFSFTHALVRDCLYEALSLGQRGAWHGKLAQALLARAPAGDPRLLAEIAHHSLLALPSDLTASVRFARAAAAAARASSGFEAAAEILARVIQKHETEAGDPVERCELLYELGANQSAAGAMRAAWNTLTRGAGLAQQLEAPELIARFALALCPWLVLGGGDETYVCGLLVQALDEIGDRAPLQRAAMLAERAQLEIEAPLRERAAWLTEAEALARECASPELDRRLACARALMRAPGQVPDDGALSERFHELDRKDRTLHADPARVHRSFLVHLSEYGSALSRCDLVTAAREAARCRALADRANMMPLGFAVDLMEAGRALAEGRLADLDVLILRLREVEYGGGVFGLSWLRYGGLLAYERGALEQFVAGLAERKPSIAELPSHARMHASLFQAWIGAKIGDRAVIERTLAEVPGPLLASLPVRPDDIALMCMLAETYAYLGDGTRAERLALQLTPFAELNALGPTYDYYGAVAHYLGELAAVQGRRREALDYYDRAAALNRRLGMPLQLARTEARRATLASS